MAKFKLVSMPFSVVGLSDQERKMVYKLVDASRQLEMIYWHQSDPKGLELLKKVSGCNQVQNQKLRRFLTINGSRYDLLEENKPFVGSDPFSTRTQSLSRRHHSRWKLTLTSPSIRRRKTRSTTLTRSSSGRAQS